MRKPRDFDAELKALADKAATVKARKLQQLGELVIATGADAVDPETLTGALLEFAETKDATKREKWRSRGAGFFQRQSRKGTNGSDSNAASDPANHNSSAAS